MTEGKSTLSPRELRLPIKCVNFATLSHGCFGLLEQQPALGALVAVVGSSSFVVVLQLPPQLGATR
jgi:hypothetical protein